MAQNVQEGPSQPKGSRQYQPGSNGILREPSSQPRRIGTYSPSENVVAHSQPLLNEEYTQDESSRPAVRTLPGTYADPQGDKYLSQN